MNVIEVQGLNKSFALVRNVKISDILRNQVDKITVLKDLNFHVKKGELLGVMGKNGAGKSTLLRVLGGIYGIESGAIRIQGDIASIFEMGTFIDIYQTGREYCKEYFYMTQTSKYDIDQILREIQEFTELGDFFDKPVRSYSSGMKAKLLFAAATQLAADIVLIDEILVVGDEYFQGKAWKRLCKMLQKGTSGVIVTHDWVSLLKLCERAMIIDKGRVDFTGNARASVQHYLGMKELVSDEVFIPNRQEIIHRVVACDCGGELVFSFQIQIDKIPEKKKLNVLIGCESFEKGIGWNFVWSNACMITVDKIGMVEIKVRMPDTGLAPGMYYLDIYIGVPPQQGERSLQRIYEEFTFLAGNAPLLQISGKKSSEAILKRRLQWKTRCI